MLKEQGPFSSNYYYNSFHFCVKAMTYRHRHFLGKKKIKAPLTSCARNFKEQKEEKRKTHMKKKRHVVALVLST